MAEQEPEIVTRNSLKTPTVLGSTIAVLLATATLWLGLLLTAAGGFIGFALLDAVGLVFALFLIGITLLVLAGISKAATGSRNVRGAIVAMIVAVVLLITLVVREMDTEMPLGIAEGPFVALLVSSAVGALTFGLFLGPRPVRVVAAVAAVGLVAAALYLPIAAQLRAALEP